MLLIGGLSVSFLIHEMLYGRTSFIFMHYQPFKYYSFFLYLLSGILIYEMLYGRTPFRGKNRQKTFANILHKDLTFPSSIPVKI